jgi:drug/metabolite transporter (DMT)-like permease
MVLLVIIAAIVGGEISSAAVLWGGLTGVAQAFGIWWFYAALAEGPMSVVSPLTAILVAGIPVVAGLLLGERFGPLAAVGVVTALIAVFLVSREARDEDVKPHRFTSRVARFTIGSGAAFGLNFVTIHQAPVEAGLWPLAFARAAASLIVLFVAIATHQARPPTGEALRLSLSAAVLDVMANICLLLALQASLLSLASVLISLYPAITVVLAMVFLGERLTAWQKWGMVVALASVAMIAAG